MAVIMSGPVTAVIGARKSGQPGLTIAHGIWRTLRSQPVVTSQIWSPPW
jgi:hypothetical protein